MKLNLCVNCGFPADSKLDDETSYHLINSKVFCSITCFYEQDKANEKLKNMKHGSYVTIKKAKLKRKKK